MGHYPTPEELDHLMQRIDTDGNGTVDFEEFAAVMADKVDDEHTNEELRELRSAFELFDADGSGRLDCGELQRALKILGVDLSTEETAFLMAQIDSDGDGDITFEEFMEYMIEFKETPDVGGAMGGP
jgi:calmodulin